MRFFAITAVLLASIGAQAADLPVKAVAPAAQQVQYLGPWQGGYIGGHVGYGYDISGLNAEGFDLGAAPRGFTGGAQLGYDWRAGSFVVGVVTDFDIADFSASTGAGGFNLSSRTNWWGTSNLRIGLPQFGDHVLLYALGGIAYGGRTSNTPMGGVSNAGFGWDVGGGLEVKLNPKASVFAQFKYVDLGSISPVPGAIQDFKFGVVQGGVNFHF